MGLNFGPVIQLETCWLGSPAGAWGFCLFGCACGMELHFADPEASAVSRPSCIRIGLAFLMPLCRLQRCSPLAHAACSMYTPVGILRASYRCSLAKIANTRAQIDVEANDNRARIASPFRQCTEKKQSPPAPVSVGRTVRLYQVMVDASGCSYR